MLTAREPQSEQDFLKITDLRWRVLRAPWNQPRGSESDNSEESSIHALIMDEDGECIATGRLQKNTSDEGQIRFMAVDPAHQGKGLGKIILEFLERRAREENLKMILLQARENAVPFYLSSGYENEGPSFLLFDSIQHYKMHKNL